MQGADRTELEVKMLKAGNKLATSIGHRFGCPKVSPAVPCACGQASKQAEALDEWQKLVQEVYDA